jgi:hypothetical protein
MKKLLTLALVVFMAFRMNAQESPKHLYLLFEFMQVNDEHGSDYWTVEDFWSAIHKQRIADKQIIGWDLWSLTPSGSQQGEQYFTVTVFPSLQAMMEAATSWDVMATAKKAYPKMAEKDLNAMMDKTVKSRDIAHQVFFRQVDKTKGDFQMQVGTMAILDVMKQKEDGYVKAESEIFKPWHQDLVDKGKKGSWELLEVILPAGSEAYGTHLTVNMFKDLTQLTTSMESAFGDMDLKTQLAMQEGLKTREWKEMKIAKLEKMIR